MQIPPAEYWHLQYYQQQMVFVTEHEKADYQRSGYQTP
jgi:hypothetical protein